MEVRDIKYALVLFGDNPHFGIAPDFSLMAQSATRDGVIESLKVLIEEAISQTLSTGRKIPVPKEEYVVRAKWADEKYEVVSVVVHV